MENFHCSVFVSLSYTGLGLATAFVARDVLGNVLSGFSLPFSIGDTIQVCYLVDE